MTELSELIGLTLVSVEKQDNDGDELVFKTDDRTFKLYHDQDCCESVYIEDICGELSDLVGDPLWLVEESSNVPPDSALGSHESVTWTFYRFATVKGFVTVRWCGSSNGYYSESVYFTEV